MQGYSIIEKAKKLGIDIGNSPKEIDNLRYIAQQVGVEDLEELDQKLDEMLKEKDDIESLNDEVEHLDDSSNLDGQNRFGEREYNQAKNKHGIYDKNYYANRGKELDEKVNKAKEEKENTQKEIKKKGQDNEQVVAQKNKNIIDRTKDNVNLAKAQRDRLQNKISGAKAKMYGMMHPGETLKDNVKAKVSNTVKDVGKKATNVAKKAVVSKGKTLIAFLAANPLALIIALVVIFIIFLLIIFLGTATNDDNSQSFNSACDAIAINNTRLSKVEFVEKVQTYFSESTSSARLVFASNAGSIYDIATHNGINPELVVVRAIKEGFSPGGSTNNYWGLGCFNTGTGNCLNYSSFHQGVMAYVQNISQYDSVSSMMSKYAYIGAYWYNPGSSSLGGCYYYPYIKDYMSSSRASEVERICASSSCDRSGGAGCTATTEEDQLAYSKWQVAEMAESRQLIFGLEPDECNYRGECIIYNQADNRWGSVHLGTSSSTMKSSGCAVSAIATGISCSGSELAVDYFDAGVFINILNRNNCFEPTGAIRWNCQGMKEVIPSLSMNQFRGIKGYTNDEKINILNMYNDDNHFILTHFKNKSHERGHYVVFKELIGDQYYALDPSGGVISTQNISEIDQIVVYSFDKKIEGDNINETE